MFECHIQSVFAGEIQQSWIKFLIVRLHLLLSKSHIISLWLQRWDSSLRKPRSLTLLA